MSKSAIRRRFFIYMGISFGSKLLYTVALHDGLGVPSAIAYPIALTVGCLQNFFLLMFWVYRTHGQQHWQQFVKYLQSVAGLYLLEWVLFLGVNALLGHRVKLSVVLVNAVLVLVKYVVYKTIVFRRKPTDETELAALDVPPEKPESDSPTDEGVTR